MVFLGGLMYLFYLYVGIHKVHKISPTKLSLSNGGVNLFV